MKNPVRFLLTVYLASPPYLDERETRREPTATQSAQSHTRTENVRHISCRRRARACPQAAIVLLPILLHTSTCPSIASGWCRVAAQDGARVAPAIEGRPMSFRSKKHRRALILEVVVGKAIAPSGHVRILGHGRLPFRVLVVLELLGDEGVHHHADAHVHRLALFL